jgi:hypothetical protein
MLLSVMPAQAGIDAARLQREMNSRFREHDDDTLLRIATLHRLSTDAQT